MGGKWVRRRREILGFRAQNHQIPYGKTCFMPLTWGRNAKNFRLRRAQRKHIIVSLPKVYTCFWSVSLSFASYFSELWRSFFAPHFRDPGGQIFCCPPFFGTLGGKWKKHLPPKWGAKYTSLSTSTTMSRATWRDETDLLVPMRASLLLNLNLTYREPEARCIE